MWQTEKNFADKLGILRIGWLLDMWMLNYLRGVTQPGTESAKFSCNDLVLTRKVLLYIFIISLLSSIHPFKFYCNSDINKKVPGPYNDPPTKEEVEEILRVSVWPCAFSGTSIVLCCCCTVTFFFLTHFTVTFITSTLLFGSAGLHYKKFYSNLNPQQTLSSLFSLLHTLGRILALHDDKRATWN